MFTYTTVNPSQNLTREENQNQNLIREKKNKNKTWQLLIVNEFNCKNGQRGCETSSLFHVADNSPQLNGNRVLVATDSAWSLELSFNIIRVEFLFIETEGRILDVHVESRVIPRRYYCSSMVEQGQ